MIDDAFQGRLLPGETIVWSGRPGQGLVFTGRDVFMIPFSLVWCTFAFSTIFGTKAGSTSGPLALFSLLFIGVGLYVVIGRFLLDVWVRREMRYAVTDRRILIMRRGPFGKFTALALTQMSDVDVTERADGHGTVRFGPAASMFANRGFGAWSPSLDPTPQFIAIDNARHVFELVQQSR